MPGGPKEAWDILSPLLQKIAAQVDGPCTDYIGPQGAGHYVKMVHNGIEYADMQLIAEAYHLLKAGLGVSSNELAPIFAEWNEGSLSSFLIEITAKCLAKNLLIHSRILLLARLVLLLHPSLSCASSSSF